MYYYNTTDSEVIMKYSSDGKKVIIMTKNRDIYVERREFGLEPEDWEDMMDYLDSQLERGIIREYC